MNKWLLIFIFTLSAIYLNAQSGYNDYLFNTLDDGTYNANADFNNSVRAISRLSNGKYIVAGDFTLYNAVVSNRIALLDSNGLIDNTFQSGTGFNGIVRSVVVDVNDNIIVGGDFTSYNGTPAWKILKLKSNGEIDTTFNNMGVGFDGNVYTIKEDANNKIIIGGDFYIYNTDSVTRIVRLNSNGTIDTTFNAGNGANFKVKAITIQNNNKVVLGGDFTSFDGEVKRKIARLNSNGSLDSTFNHASDINGGFNGNVNALDIFNDKIIVGGDFTKYDNINVNQIVVLNQDGSRDTTFSPVLFMNSVNTLQVLENNKIVFAGNPYVNGSVPYPNIIMIDSTGSEDISFNNGNGFNNNVYVVIKDSNNKLMVGGQFLKYFNNVDKKYIVRLKSNGYPDSQFKTVHGFDKAVHAVELHQNNGILVGGEFTSYNGELVNQLALLKPNGEFDSNFFYSNGPRFGSSSSFSPFIYQILSQNDGKIMVSGTFDYYNDVYRNSMVRLKSDGIVDSTFSMNLNTSTSSINTFVMQPDGKYIIGGTFTNAFYGINRNNRIARVFSNGLRDNTFVTGSGFNNTVYTIELQSDGKCLVGGRFTSYDGVNKSALVRLKEDGSLDTGFLAIFGAGEDVKTITVLPDSSIIVGGTFAKNINGFKRNLVKLKKDGIIDSTFNYNIISTIFAQTPSSAITSVKLHPSGNLIIAGVMANGRYGIVSLTQDGDVDSLFHSSKTNSSSEYIYDLKIQDDNKVLYVGNYKSYDNVVRNKIGRLLYLPSIDSITGNSICDSIGNTTLTAYSSYNNPVFNWYDTIVGGTSLFTGASFVTPTLTSSKTYYVSVTSDNQTSYSRDSITVFLNSPLYNYLSFDICNGESINIGNNLYNTTGNNIDTLISIYGCDSVVFSSINVYPTYWININDTICQGDSSLVAGEYQNTAGVYYDSLQTINGCDSIIEYILYIDTLLSANFSQTIDSGDSLNLLVTNLSIGNNLTYLWDFGDGTTSTDSFPTHIYSSIGVYNLCLTTTDSLGNCFSIYCDSTSIFKTIGIKFINSITTSIDFIESSNMDNILIYPNPSNGYFIIDLGEIKEAQIVITSIEGKVLYNQVILDKKSHVDVSKWTRGLYFVRIKSGDSQINISKIIIQ